MRRLHSKFVSILLLLFALWVQPAQAAIAVVTGPTQAQAASNPTTASVDTSGANLIVFFVHYRAASGICTPGDSKGNTWIALTARTNTTQAGIRIYYATNSPTVGSGHTFSCTGDFATISVTSYSGAHATSPFDVENGAAADSSGATIQPGSVTPSVDNCVVVVGLTEGNTPGGGGPTINGSFSAVTYTAFNAGTSARGGAVSRWIQTTATATNPTWTVSGVLEYATAIAVFKPAAAGGAVPKMMLLGVGVPR